MSDFFYPKLQFDAVLGADNVYAWAKALPRALPTAREYALAQGLPITLQPSLQ